MPRTSRILMSEAEFTALAARLTAQNAPPPAPDVLGALRSAVTGRVIALAEGPAEPALPADVTAPAAAPAPYRLTQWTESGDSWTAVNDRLELDVHGAASMTHVDTTAHFRWDGARDVPPAGDPLVALAGAGIVARGVLVDVPGVLGVDVAGRVVTRDDVAAVLDRTGTELRPGDVLHVHLGRREPARSDVPLGSVATAGLSIECAEWLAAARPAAVVTDEGLDPMPSEVDGLPVPWHVLLLTALDIPLVDRATLAELSAACRDAGRWEFLSVLAPLPIPGTSGSPLNPLAIL